jgi:hypothetical protein
VGYYIRVLGEQDVPITTEELTDVLKGKHVSVVEEGGDWTIRHTDGPEITVIERNPVVEGQLGTEEVQEFIEEVDNCKPESAARWLRNYLPKVRVIYAFQLLSGTDVNDGWGAVHRLQSYIWNKTGGILQADGEGFSNPDGYQILWQFSDTVKGPWNVAVIDRQSKWIPFEMDLGDPVHREAFWSGRVPEGAKRL